MNKTYVASSHLGITFPVKAEPSLCQADRRKERLKALTRHPAFRAAHPREDHFVPIYVAAGAGEDGAVEIINGLYGQPTIAFGL